MLFIYHLPWTGNQAGKWGKEVGDLAPVLQDADDVVQEMGVQIEQKWQNWRVCCKGCLGVFTETVKSDSK